MDTAISQVLELLNRRYGCNLSGEHYARVEQWRAWWMGLNKGFHEYQERGPDGRTRTRRIYGLGMAKKVCEDWASLLLNEKTRLALEDGRASRFLQGKDGLGGILGENDFWRQGNALVERAFMSGEGAFVLSLSGARVQDGRVLVSPQARLRIQYLDASGIVPLSFAGGRITEAAFVSRTVEQGQPYVLVEVHTREGGGYVIRNLRYSVKDGSLSAAPLPEGVAEAFCTGSDIPWFATLHPNIVSNLANTNGLGLSVLANAIDNLKGVDLAFNNFCRDFKLGGKKVFYNKAMLQTDREGKPLTPDDVAQQLFMQVGDELEFKAETMVQEFNPSLRVEENRQGVQAQLDYLSFKCGLGARRYQFTAEKVMTATEYAGGRQELVQNANKHMIVLEQALRGVTRAILYAGKAILGVELDADTGVTVQFEDGFIIDKEAERQRDLMEVRDGLMPKWEYRMKWRGEEEATAKRMVAQDGALPFGEP